MPVKNKAVDAYIEKSADFAKPILEHFREIVHYACPDVEEKIKWSMPFFDYKDEMMCHMAAFKQHCAVGFWKGSIMKDPVLRETAASETAMGHLGRISSLKDLPSDKKLMSWIKEAMELNDNGIKLPPKIVSKEKQALIVPDDLTKALSKHKAARNTFEAFSYSHKKEYIQWITEAKTAPTRSKRLLQAIEMMTEGKSRNAKYATGK